MSSNEIRNLKLNNLIKEAVTLALYEQKLNEQPAQPPVMPPPPGQQQQANPVPPMPQPPEAEQNMQPPNAPQAPSQPMTVDTMIERLNVVRGGRSFTDPEIYGQLTTFYKRLSPEQIQQIDQFLQDLTKIVVNVENTSQQQQPDQTQQTPQTVNQQGPISPNPAAMPQAAGGPVPNGPMGGM